MKVIDVLGTPLAVTSYEELIEHCHNLMRLGGIWALNFANTQIVTKRRHEAAFCGMTSAIDLFVPDGMPLIWALNWRGANLTDRVYGPTFMRRFLDAAPFPATHYLLGGSEEGARRLRKRFPGSSFVGGFHGNCSTDGLLNEGSADSLVIEEINRIVPDFVWVGLGTPKQDAWIFRNKSRIKRGVILAVGFAFDVNAGTKADAPLWMQRRGLTWVFRILSEPRRLLGRYLRYNSLFIFYLLRDSLRSAK
jgi:N-acetylglucosaminyldiphosphoundecaprenol N-acetyl-beta-D-mannosaminyltransferase